MRKHHYNLEVRSKRLVHSDSPSNLINIVYTSLKPFLHVARQHGMHLICLPHKCKFHLGLNVSLRAQQFTFDFTGIQTALITMPPPVLCVLQSPGVQGCVPRRVHPLEGKPVLCHAILCPSCPPQSMSACVERSTGKPRCIGMLEQCVDMAGFSEDAPYSRGQVPISPQRTQASAIKQPTLSVPTSHPESLVHSSPSLYPSHWRMSMRHQQKSQAGISTACRYDHSLFHALSYMLSTPEPLKKCL